MAFAHAFDDFGYPPGSKKELILEVAAAFFQVQEFNDFRGEKPRSQSALGGRGGAP